MNAAKRIGAPAFHITGSPSRAERDGACDTAQLLCTAEDVFETRCAGRLDRLSEAHGHGVVEWRFCWHARSFEI